MPQHQIACDLGVVPDSSVKHERGTFGVQQGGYPSMTSYQRGVVLRTCRPPERLRENEHHGDRRTGRQLHGMADERLQGIPERLAAYLENDPDLSFQAAPFNGGEQVPDVLGRATAQPGTTARPAATAGAGRLYGA